MSRPPIRAVELHGRLGNQLFQFAMLRALLPDGQPVLVETIAADDYPLRAALRSESFRRLIVGESLRLRRPPSAGGPRRRNLSGVIRRLPGRGYTGWMGRSGYRERLEGCYDPEVAAVDGDVLFCGFFQNEQYFVGESPGILDALVPISQAASSHVAMVKDLGRDKSSIAVVVRAGLDYVNIGWDAPLLWYTNAVEHVLEEVSNPSFAVFSDIPLCAEAVATTLRRYGPAHPVLGLDAVEQLHVMARMDHVVSAATSFGWWGAWLGDALRGFAGRSVVVPDPWITPGCQSAPARWSRVSAQTVSS